MRFTVKEINHDQNVERVIKKYKDDDCNYRKGEPISNFVSRLQDKFNLNKNNVENKAKKVKFNNIPIDLRQKNQENEIRKY